MVVECGECLSLVLKVSSSKHSIRAGFKTKLTVQPVVDGEEEWHLHHTIAGTSSVSSSLFRWPLLAMG